MERCFGLQADAGVYGIIVCGSLGENMALEPEETLEILNIARSAAGSKPVLMTVCESSTKRGAAAAKAAAKAGGSGFMVLPGVPYKSAPEETLTHVQTIAAAGGLPIMVYNNPIAYGVDVTIPMFEELAKNDLVVAFPKETVTVYKLVQAGRLDEARAIYRWFRQLVDSMSRPSSSRTSSLRKSMRSSRTTASAPLACRFPANSAGTSLT
ncbi:4-hydroxy-tetrahydrodipicolinate synthase [Rhizobium mongolense]|uniref:4-hydroxy-tetrahydrodipicolinate synthase n=1 Tax=Rhizobium mongolense TaxID=57676 RepID=A0A7W6WGY6_9HYPH|nr:4-hydroxy-tetrahydrodipicolinate synthase [Rhizobium mongolense]